MVMFSITFFATPSDFMECGDSWGEEKMEIWKGVWCEFGVGCGVVRSGFWNLCCGKQSALVFHFITPLNQNCHFAFHEQEGKLFWRGDDPVRTVL
jgi:hypothetical protein